MYLYIFFAIIVTALLYPLVTNELAVRRPDIICTDEFTAPLFPQTKVICQGLVHVNYTFPVVEEKKPDHNKMFLVVETDSGSLDIFSLKEEPNNGVFVKGKTQ